MPKCINKNQCLKDTKLYVKEKPLEKWEVFRRLSYAVGLKFVGF